jgi:hypothetical protein
LVVNFLTLVSSSGGRFEASAVGVAVDGSIKGAQEPGVVRAVLGLISGGERDEEPVADLV